VTAPIYDRIGIGYDVSRRADPYLLGRLQAWLGHAATGPVLDIGCGTGNYTGALAARGLNLCGVDPSLRMLTEARDKSSVVRWQTGCAEALPFADAAFAGAVATLTVHHWKDLERAFGELFRVLRPRGRLVLFTSTPQQMRGYWLYHYFPRMLERSMQVMPTLEHLRAAMTAVGFRAVQTEPYAVRTDLCDLFLYSGKHAPERYLDAEFRRGISSFAALADPDELEAGLGRLELDLRSGLWRAVAARFADLSSGDYVFVAADRT
jgi:ubiquinone/menaquinone biosynthesis C-methylase UbiE